MYTRFLYTRAQIEIFIYFMNVCIYKINNKMRFHVDNNYSARAKRVVQLYQVDSIRKLPDQE